MEQRGDDAAVSESPSSSESGGNFEITFGDARARVSILLRRSD